MVSVVVPVYNTEKYLARCLEALAGQTYVDLEIIVVNDGSTDNCAKIIAGYAEKDARFKVIDKQNGGLPSAVRAGVELASGEYTVFVDSDDYVGAKYVETFVSDLGGYDVLCAGFYFDDGKDIIPFRLKRDCVYRDKNLEELKKRFVFDGCFGNSNLIFCARWNKIYKTAVIKKFAERYASLNLKLYEDAFFTLLLLNCNPSVKAMKAPNEYYYNISDISTTRKVKTVADFEDTALKLLSADKILEDDNIERHNLADILVAYAGMEHINDYAVRFPKEEAVARILEIAEHGLFANSLKFFRYSQLNLKSKIKLFLCTHKKYGLLYECMK